MRTLLGQGAKAMENHAAEPVQSDGESVPRNSAQDAAELNRRENRERSSAEDARTLNEREKWQEAVAAGTGALGGMVQSKGQHGKGKLTGSDPIIKEATKKYGAKKEKVTNGLKNELKELSQKAKQAKGKERTKILRRKDAIKGALKLLPRYFRTPLVTPFTEEQLRGIMHGENPNDQMI